MHLVFEGSWCKAKHKLKAKITIDGININLGMFATIEEAKEVRIKKTNAYFGNFTNAIEKNFVL